MAEYVDAQGITIVYDVHPAVGTPRAVVQLAHGVGDHAGRYGDVIAALTAAGYTVYADDHRGHGRTGMKQWNGDASKLGKLGPGGLRATIAAVWQFSQLIAAENPGVPLIFLGHSWGSMLAQHVIADHADAFDALVLSGSALLTLTGVNMLPLNKRWDGPTATGTEWLAADLSVGERFRQDPLTTEEPLMKLFGVADALRLQRRPPRHIARDIPVLIMVGADDAVGGPKSNHRLAQEYRERSGLTDVTTLVYPGMRHEIFNEAQRATVFADLLAWLNARFPLRA